jgi:hypothetical protein
LREVDGAGQRHVEEFEVPDDATAIRRIKGEVRGVSYQLWQGDWLLEEGKPKRDQGRQFAIR